MAKKYISLGQLSIASELLDFVNNELLPGTNIDKENFWILSRKPIMEKNLLTKIIEKTKLKGYDLSNLIIMPQDERYSKCLTRWIKEDSEQNIDRSC